MSFQANIIDSTRSILSIGMAFKKGETISSLFDSRIGKEK